ncbi:MAG: hypothetical protein J3T61_11285, partial [Candidatus Brocadiales bacterium]|nr:hypothetical protein [Candidatus Bathyanammoxibius sp.]
MNRPYPRLRFFATWTLLFGLTLVSILSQTGQLTNVEVSRVVFDIRNDGLNEMALDLMTENYYQELTGHRSTKHQLPPWVNSVKKMAASLAGIERPAVQPVEGEGNRKLNATPVMQKTGDYFV